MIPILNSEFKIEISQFNNVPLQNVNLETFEDLENFEYTDYDHKEVTLYVGKFNFRGHIVGLEYFLKRRARSSTLEPSAVALKTSIYIRSRLFCLVLNFICFSLSFSLDQS